MLKIRIKGYELTEKEINDNKSNQFDDINDKIDCIMKMIHDKEEHMHSLTNVEETTSLDEYEVNEVLNDLLRLQDEHFSLMPMRIDLVKQFMWNIPYEVYELWKNYYKNKQPEIFNPLLYFYIFCVKNIDECMPYFIRTIMSLVDDDMYKEIMDKAKKYEKYYG